jgi:heme exporter protein C
MKRWWRLLHPWMSPKFVLTWIQQIQGGLGVLSLVLMIIGMGAGLFIAPADAVQGEGFRMLYVHVPAAILSMSIFSAMAVAAFIGLIWRVKLAFWVMEASAPIGASMTLLTLLTGAIWGKPMWGTWWIWDARLTSELILFFLYMGVIGVIQAFSNRKTGHRAGAIAVLIGAIDIPIIHYSVEWWNTLHQGATLKFFEPSHIHPDMLWPLVVVILGMLFLYAWALCLRLRLLICDYEPAAETWLKKGGAA